MSVTLIEVGRHGGRGVYCWLSLISTLPWKSIISSRRIVHSFSILAKVVTETKSIFNSCCCCCCCCCCCYCYYYYYNRFTALRILSGTTRMRWYQNVKPGRKNQSGFTGSRDSEWQWHQLGHMQICTSPRQKTTSASRQSVFTGRMLFPPLNQQHQSTKGTMVSKLINQNANTNPFLTWPLTSALKIVSFNIKFWDFMYSRIFLQHSTSTQTYSQCNTTNKNTS